MKKIASFTVNHDVLPRGMYLSRVDGDVVTYDVRMKLPNKGDYLENAAMHTFEHLFATWVRNTEFADKVIYVGPMGCRTGFYFLVRDAVSHAQAIALVQGTLEFVAAFEGEIPGAASTRECGNVAEHDLAGAKAIAADMLPVLANWTPEQLVYPE